MTDAKQESWKVLRHPAAHPWMGLVAAYPAGIGAHWALSGDPATAAAVTLVGGALTLGTHAGLNRQEEQTRLAGTVAMGSAAGWLVIATVADPLQQAVTTAYFVIGSGLAAWWNVIQSRKRSFTAAQGTDGQAGILAKAIGNAKVALRGKPKVEPNKVTAELQLSGGEVTASDLGNRIKNIAGELGVSPNSIKIMEDPDDAARATLVIVPEDMLKKATPWPGPSSLGGSVTDPVVIGIYEDGATAQLWFPWAQGRNATHFLTAGMNGSGKSAGVSVAMTEVLTRRDVVVWAIDPSKGHQTFGPFLPYLDWVEMTMSGGEAMIAALTDVITARASEMGRHGHKNWTPEVHDQLGMPYMVVWIEEAAKFFRDGTEMEGLVMEARSAGISVIISLQRPSASSMPTDVREQLGGALVFGVKGGTTADMALPEDVRDAGARPEVWQNRRPGYAYLVAPGVDEERYPFPMRTYLIEDSDIEGALAIAPRVELDPVTAEAAGEAYADRERYTAEDMAGTYAVADGLEQAGIDPDTITLSKTPISPPTSADEDRDAMIEDQVNREIAQSAGFNPDDMPPVDPEAEIPPVPADKVVHFDRPAPAAPQRDLTTEEAEAEILVLLDEFRDEGLDLVGPKDFIKHCGKAGRLNRGRSWLSPRLADLADEGIHLAETDEPGVYRLLDPEPANA